MELTFERHKAEPTHNLDQLKWLCNNLSSSVYMDVGYLDGEPAAGVGYFVMNRRTVISFYLCNDPLKRDSQALSKVLSQGMARFKEQGFKWFILGTSSTNMVARPNVFMFKETFGAIGMFRESYKWKK